MNEQKSFNQNLNNDIFTKFDASKEKKDVLNYIPVNFSIKTLFHSEINSRV